MKRDEILDAIAEESTVRGVPVPSLTDIRSRMRSVAQLADEYMDNETGDVQYVAEALQTATRRFADMLALHL